MFRRLPVDINLQFLSTKSLAHTDDFCSVNYFALYEREVVREEKNTPKICLQNQPR